MSVTDNMLKRWTSADLERLPDDGMLYEIIDGELFEMKSPHWKHQEASGNIYMELKLWSRMSRLGQPALAPGMLFSEVDHVIPDVVWTSDERLATLLDEAGHLTGAPELVVEVLSPGKLNAERDRETKRKLYAAQGVLEYWIADWQTQQLEVYRRDAQELRLVGTLHAEDEVTSPLLPGFTCPVARLFT